MGQLVTLEHVHSRPEWAEIISNDWRRSIESIIQTGRDLAAAKADLLHGEFLTMIKDDLPFSVTTAESLMRIAVHPAIAKSAAPGNLPPSWAVLGELAFLSAEDFQEAQERGLITSKMSQSAARAVAGAYKTPAGEAVGEGKNPAHLPKPEDARRIARETGRLIAASDGNTYSGATKEEEREYVTRRTGVFRVCDAIEIIAAGSLPPDQWINESEPHWLFDLNPVKIKSAADWLLRLHDLWNVGETVDA